MDLLADTDAVLRTAVHTPHAVAPLVAAHLHRIPPLDRVHPPHAHRPRTLVAFRAMLQDSSPQPQLFPADAPWGLDHLHQQPTSHPVLAECAVFWAVSIPGLTQWLAPEPQHVVQSSTRPHKWPLSSSPSHLGVQLKIYDPALAQPLRPTHLCTFYGVLDADTLYTPDLLDSHHHHLPSVPTLHVLLTRPIPSTVVPRVYPHTDLPHQLRDHLISWIADYALAGDAFAAEWLLLSLVSRVHSRTPPILPLSLSLSSFPASRIQDLLDVLSSLLPLVTTLPLSLNILNNLAFAPHSIEEDLHSGPLQLPKGSLCLITENAVSEGPVLEKGIMNIRAVQQVIATQSLDYVFPFSSFAFDTDITMLVLTEAKSSAFFQTHVNVPLKPLDKPKCPPPSADQLELFRALVGGAKTGTVTIGEQVGAYIQNDFVAERKSAIEGDQPVSPDDLILRMSIARLLALSMHLPEVTTDVYKRAKALEAGRKART